MSIRFAAPPSSIRNLIDGVKARSACAVPANDNGAPKTNEIMLHEALRHFATHGLAAAHHARQQAEQARIDGDEQTYCYWRDICRALDRRMARELDQSISANC